MISFPRASVSFPHRAVAGTVAQVVHCTSEPADGTSENWNPAHAPVTKPVPWPELRPVWSEEEAPLLHLPKGVIIKDSDSSDFYSNTDIVLALLVTQIPNSTSPKYATWAPGVCFVLSAAACPPIVHLGDILSQWSWVWEGSVQPAQPGLPLQSVAHAGYTVTSIYVTGLNCAFDWGSISSFSFWVIWQQDTEWDPFMSAAKSSVVLAKLDL